MAVILDYLQLAVIEVESKLMRPLQTIERQIIINLQRADAKTRPVESNGLWCHLLLPIALLVYTCVDSVSHLYKLTSLISIGLLCYSVLFLLYLSVSSDVLKQPVYAGCVASSVTTGVLLSCCLKLDLIFSLIISLIAIILYAWVLKLCIIDFHYTFSIGEAMIMSQAVVLFLMMSVIKFFFEFHNGDDDLEFISVIIYTVLSTVGLIVTALYFLTETQRNLTTLCYIVGCAAVIVLVTLHSIFGLNALPTILYYIFMEHNRAQLITFWLFLLILAVCALTVRTKLAVKASTVTRKTFHILASLVFLSGIICDVYLMMLAAGLGLGVLILVEALRKSNIEPISSALQSAFLVYCDEKDCGLFAMTPLYLYIGLAFPLLLVPNGVNRELELLSGVMSIGVGDTAASWFGSRFGFNKWPDSSKTLEGTIFNILSQIGTVYALQLFGLLTANNALFRITVSATISGFVEARTLQVDNLVLPLVTMLALQATWIVC